MLERMIDVAGLVSETIASFAILFSGVFAVGSSGTAGSPGVAPVPESWLSLSVGASFLSLMKLMLLSGYRCTNGEE